MTLGERNEERNKKLTRYIIQKLDFFKMHH